MESSSLNQSASLLVRPPPYCAPQDFSRSINITAVFVGSSNRLPPFSEVGTTSYLDANFTLLDRALLGRVNEFVHHVGESVARFDGHIRGVFNALGRCDDFEIGEMCAQALDEDGTGRAWLDWGL